MRVTNLSYILACIKADLGELFVLQVKQAQKRLAEASLLSSQHSRLDLQLILFSAIDGFHR